MVRKKTAYKAIAALIVLVWAGTWLLNSGYIYWPALAGLLTFHLLLAALVVDNMLE